MKTELKDCTPPPLNVVSPMKSTAELGVALSSRGRRTLDRFPFLGFSFVFSLWTPSSSLTPHRSLELPPISFSPPIRSRAARPFRFWPSGEVHRENRRFPGRTLTANGGVFPRLSSATRVLSRRTRRTEQQTERERGLRRASSPVSLGGRPAALERTSFFEGDVRLRSLSVPSSSLSTQ
ncbi:hypothetical protein TGME49_221518 [Toxoplasma gondii ME49]|uniref:Uncharacterized protein n=2 Tax=Toxoplasma gondii TaxID=5811 RepID=S8GJF8_TOXGM|nr:hypothetical protein TGME49_221518 [Toxoplasma gondii ME49]EPT31990.1 hypothetical protein TGME49_221518 [Toxoplasma gondii ME49]KYF42675.1 hypothetical protein TGARI_221518 [Toxoplasma gondii ARI]|eukprot:XP_018638271.1 hypothetical protein TGME49_221518 [Toxoplasma gondii ME49]